MKELTYKQLNKKKVTIFFTAYLLYFLFVLGFVLFSPYDIVNLINSTRTGIFPGLVGAVILLCPLLIYAKLTDLIKLKFDESRLNILSANNELSIDYSDISVMKTSINTLSLYDVNQRLLYTFKPSKDTAALQKIITNIKKYVSFNVEKTNKKLIGGYVELQTYTVKKTATIDQLRRK